MAILHNYNTRGAMKKLANVPHSKTNFYGTHSITAKSVKEWNSLHNLLVFEFDQEQFVTSKIISTLKEYFLAF